MQLQNYGAEYDPETGTVTQFYRDVSTDPMNWEPKVSVKVVFPAEFVTFTDLTAPEE